jgi:large subunit ribosomal protein L10
MPSSKNIKQLEELADKLSKAKAIYITEYLGLNVEEVTELRREFHSNQVEYKVTKNTILKLAAEKNNLKGLDDFLNKSTAIALSYDDPTSPAKVIKKFTKENDLPQVKGIVFDGEVFDGSEFKRFADVPSKEESLSKLIALLQSPLIKLALTLKAPLSNVSNALNNLKENKSN